MFQFFRDCLPRQWTLVCRLEGKKLLVNTDCFWVMLGGISYFDLNSGLSIVSNTHFLSSPSMITKLLKEKFWFSGTPFSTAIKKNFDSKSYSGFSCYFSRKVEHEVFVGTFCNLEEILPGGDFLSFPFWTWPQELGKQFTGSFCTLFMLIESREKVLQPKDKSQTKQKHQELDVSNFCLKTCLNSFIFLSWKFKNRTHA